MNSSFSHRFQGKEPRVGDRVAIFIDGSNLYHALKTNFRRNDLNFSEFINRLCGSRTLYRSYYYNILQDPAQWPEGYRDQQDFLTALKMTPYLEVKLGTTKIGQGTQVEKGIDIMLATDMLSFAWNDLYDIAVLVSGDGDFTYAMQTIKNMGKYVEIAYFRTGISKDLLDMADNRQLLDQNFFQDLWVSKRRSPVPGHRRRSPKIANRNQQIPPPPVMTTPEPSEPIPPATIYQDRPEPDWEQPGF